MSNSEHGRRCASHAPGGYLEFYATSGYAAFPHTVRHGGSVPIAFLHAEQEAHGFVDPAVPETVIVLALRASDMPFRWNVGDGWSDARVRTGDFNLCPPNTEIAYECGANHELLAMVLPTDRLNALIQRESARVSTAQLEPLTARTVFRDDTIRKAMLQMWAECARDDPAATLLVDGLANVVLGQLLRLAGSPLDGKTRTFDAATLARIDDYVHAHLEHRIGVEELAALTGLSRFRFSRTFSATTGVSPYQHVTQLRAEHARQRIEAGRETLVEIALACGYASQSHMNEAFRRHLGVTPGQCRKP